MVYPVHPRIEFDEATLVRLHTSDARVTPGNAILAKIPNSRPLVLPSDGYGIAAAEADQCETNVSSFDKSGASGRQKQLRRHTRITEPRQLTRQCSICPEWQGISAPALVG